MDRSTGQETTEVSLTVEEREELRQLRIAAQTAYWHLDTFGIVSGHPEQIESQKRVFDLLRPHCPPIPGRL